jgi:uncharacterized membrane protein
MMMVANTNMSGGVEEIAAMAKGVSAAFRFAAILTCVGWVVAIFKVGKIKVDDPEWQDGDTVA